MKILFSMRHPGALRNFSTTIRALESRGHTIHLAFVMQDKLGDGRLLWELTDDHPAITYSEAERKTPFSGWLGLARGVRFWVDYLRYLGPDYRDAFKLRERAEQRLPRFVRTISRLPVINTAAGRRVLSRLLVQIDRAIPVNREVEKRVRVEKPDVILVTPLVDLGSDQTDYVKCAKQNGIPVGLCVHSWDNLTNKGLMRLVPDRVFVWNEAQKKEAVEMHGCRPEQVVVTGAPVFDQWFARRPSTTREEFCAKTGLPVDRPFFLYLCSSAFIAPNESDFVTAWLRALRSAPDERLRDAPVLMRPHPENLQPWQRFDFAEFPNAVLWPRGGANPIDAASKNDFFDSIYHSIAAVGINTTAQIEAGIVGRPVYTIKSEEHEGTQEGTLHFHYLLNEGGGLLHHAKDFDEHVGQLAGALDRTEEDQRKLRSFVQAFVRPHGLETPATPLIADGVEAMGSLPARGPQRLGVGLFLLRLGLYPAAFAMNVSRQFLRTRRKRERQLRPLTIMGTLLKPTFRLLDWILRWSPAKSFARRYIVPRVMPRLLAADGPTEEMVAIPRIIQKLAESDRPLIVGPWLSEVGFEVLYWIPFLNWVRTYRKFDPERLIIVSRGGVAPWYRNIGARYVDLFDFFTPEQFRTRNEQRQTDGSQKQRTMTEFDREILKLVKIAIENREVDVLHPMYMYRLFYPYWKNRASAKFMREFAYFERLPPIDASDIAGQLPASFIAVRFYFNDCFPDTEDNRVFVRRLLQRLTQTSDVVLLNPGLHLDDHWDLTPDASRRIHTIEHLITPRNNLEIQTKVISLARAFIGNYGGLSYVAPFYGVDSLAFYSVPDGFQMTHLELAYRVFAEIKRGSFVALDTQAVDLVDLAIGGLGRSSWAQAEAASAAQGG